MGLVGIQMKVANDQQALASKVHLANRIHGAVRAMLISTVVLVATLFVGLSGFSA